MTQRAETPNPALAAEQAAGEAEEIAHGIERAWEAAKANGYPIKGVVLEPHEIPVVLAALRADHAKAGALRSPKLLDEADKLSQQLQHEADLIQPRTRWRPPMPRDRVAALLCRASEIIDDLIIANNALRPPAPEQSGEDVRDLERALRDIHTLTSLRNTHTSRKAVSAVRSVHRISGAVIARLTRADRQPSEGENTGSLTRAELVEKLADMEKAQDELRERWGAAERDAECQRGNAQDAYEKWQKAEAKLAETEKERDVARLERDRWKWSRDTHVAQTAHYRKLHEAAEAALREALEREKVKEAELALLLGPGRPVPKHGSGP